MFSYCLLQVQGRIGLRIAVSAEAILASSRKHAYIILTPLNPTFI